MVYSRNSSKIVLIFLLLLFCLSFAENSFVFSLGITSIGETSQRTIYFVERQLWCSTNGWVCLRNIRLRRRIGSILFRSQQQQINEKSPSRIFLPRNSILTDLFEISHFQSLRNACAATLILLFIQDTITDYIEDGR